MGLLQRLGNDITHPFGLFHAQPGPARTPAPGIGQPRPIAQTPMPQQQNFQPRIAPPQQFRPIAPQPLQPQFHPQPFQMGGLKVQPQAPQQAIPRPAVQPQPRPAPPQQPHASILHDLTHNPVTNLGGIAAKDIGAGIAGTAHSAGQIASIPYNAGKLAFDQGANRLAGRQPNASPAAQNALNATNRDIGQVVQFAQFAPRAVMQVRNSIGEGLGQNGGQQQLGNFRPQPGIQQAILGKQPIPSLQQVYKTTRAQQGTQQAAVGTGLTALMDALAVKGGVDAAAKGAPKLLTAAKSTTATVADHTIPLAANEAGGIPNPFQAKFNGLPKQQVIMDTRKLDTLNNARQMLTTGSDDVPTRNAVNQGLYKIKNENGLNFISGSPADRLQRITQYLEQNGEAIPKLQNGQADPLIPGLRPLNQIGAVGKDVTGQPIDPLASLKQEALKYKSADEFVKAQQTKASDYVGSHQAPTNDGFNAPAHDVSGGEAGIYPKDIYTDPKAYHYYGHGGPHVGMDKQSVDLIRSIKDKPNADVTIYRSVPKGQTGDINPGDWVTLNKDYAQQHGDSQFNGKSDILSKKVKAGELFTDGNSIHEFGYDPRNSNQQLTDLYNQAHTEAGGAAKTYYRGGGEGSMPKGLTAKDVLHYENNDLGNADVKPVNGVDLSKVKSDNLQWVTGDKASAREYGKATPVEVGNHRVIATDGQGGYLIEKQAPPGSHHPTIISKAADIAKGITQPLGEKGGGSVEDSPIRKALQGESAIPKEVQPILDHYKQFPTSVDMEAVKAEFQNNPAALKAIENAQQEVKANVATSKVMAQKQAKVDSMFNSAKTVGDIRAAEKAQRQLQEEGKPSEAPALEPAQNSVHSSANGNTAPQPKQRGLTGGMKGSQYFSPELKQGLKSSYSPSTDKAATMETSKFMAQPLEQAHMQVLQTLGKNRGVHLPGASGNLGTKFGKQEVSNAGAVMQALDKAGRYDDAQAIHDMLGEKLTEAGQRAQAAKLIYNRSPEGLRNMGLKALGDAGVKKTPQLGSQIDAAIAKIKTTTDGTKENNLARAQYDKLIGSHLPTSTGTKLLSLYKTGILSSPKTAVKVLGAGLPNAIMEHTADTVAAPIDKAVSLFTGKRSMTAPGIRSLTAEAKALPGALSDAKTRFTKDIAMPGSTGLGTTELSGTNARPHGANFGVAKGGGRTKLDQATGGASSKILNGYTSSIGRVHGAFQTVPYETRAAGSLMQTALAEAKTQKLTGADRNAFVDKFISNPPQWAKDIADESAQYATNQQHTALGAAASGLQHTLPGGQVIAPITRIPGAVATNVINYSPFGALKTGAKAVLDKRAGNEFNQQAFSRGLGRSIVGTGLMGGGAALALNGRVSGAYPKDKATQQLWTSANIPANSVYVGGHAYPGEPWKNTGGTWQQITSPGGAGAQSLVTGGAAVDGYKQGGATGAVLGGTQGGAQIVLNQPYLTGISGAMGAVNTPAQAKTFLDQTAGSVVPNFVRDTATSTDPLQRQTSVQSPVTSMKNAVTNGIPGLREKNQPQLDVFGNQLARNNGVLNAALNPLNPQKSTPTPLTNAMGAVHNTLDANGKPLSIPTQEAKKIQYATPSGKKATLSDAQRTQFIKQSGQAAQTSLNQLINTSTFKNATAEQQQKMIADTVSGQRNLAMSQMPNSAVKLSGAGKAAKDGNAPTIGADGKVHTGGVADLNPNVPGDQQKILKAYAAMSSSDRTKAAYSQPNFDYNYAVAKYANDKANGSLSKAADITARAAIDKANVGKNYSKDVRDLYGLSKAQIDGFITTDPNGKTYANQLLAYDKALHDAGLTSSLKFKNGFGTTTTSSSGKKTYASGASSGSTKLPTPISFKNTAPKTSLGKFKLQKANAGGGKVKLASYKLPKAPKVGAVNAVAKPKTVRLAKAPTVPKVPKPTAVKKVRKGVYV